jgi:disulfide bond formation protein DsbB
VPVNGGTASLERHTPWTLAGLFGLGLLGLIAGRKRFSSYMALICLALMLAGISMGIAACTNAGYSTPPPAPKVTTPTGTYNVQIITYDPQTLQQNSLSTPLFTLPVTVQ